MKISAKFLLSSVFVFLPAVGGAQDNFNLLLRQINQVQQDLDERQFGLEMKLVDQQKDIKNFSERQDALEKALKDAKFDIDFLKSMRGFADTKTDDTSKKLIAVESELHESEERLAKAEWKIEMLDLRLSAIEPRASKYTVPVRNPTPGKPTAPANKPTPAAKEGTH